MTIDSTTTGSPNRPPAQGSGNRCGHDPSAPRWFAPPPDHGDRPPIILKWSERVREFFERPNVIPSLAGVLFTRKLREDPTADNRTRKMRSERREACCSLLGAIAHYCDLPSLCLSVPQPDGTLRPVRMDTLAERAGLAMRRAERAMRDLVEAGLLSVHPRCELETDGSYTGMAAIRVVQPEFFGLFGLEERLKNDRPRISKKRREKAAKEPGTRTGRTRVRISMKAAINAITGKSSKPARAEPAAADVSPAPSRATVHPTLRDLKAMLTGSAGPEPSDKRDKRQASLDRAAAEAESDYPDYNHDPP